MHYWKKTASVVAVSLVLAGCGAFGIPSIPEIGLAREWSGQPIENAIAKYGQPRETQKVGGSKTAYVWYDERYEPRTNRTGEVILINNVITYIEETENVRYLCRITIEAENGTITSFRLRSMAGIGPAKAGACTRVVWADR